MQSNTLPSSSAPDERRSALESMHASQAWEQALLAAAHPPEVLMERMSWSIHSLRRYLSPERHYPTFVDIPVFCRHAGNEIVIEWLIAQTRKGDFPRLGGELGCFELMERVAQIFEATGAVAQKAREAVADRQITEQELRSIIKVLELSSSANLRLLNDLQSLAANTRERTRAGGQYE